MALRGFLIPFSHWKIIFAILWYSCMYVCDIWFISYWYANILSFFIFTLNAFVIIWRWAIALACWVQQRKPRKKRRKKKRKKNKQKLNGKIKYKWTWFLLPRFVKIIGQNSWKKKKRKMKTKTKIKIKLYSKSNRMKKKLCINSRD